MSLQKIINFGFQSPRQQSLRSVAENFHERIFSNNLWLF
jgi:hypothetical protein